MPTIIQLLETPQAYNLETVISDHPQYMQLFIEYLTVPQDSFISNERQCYLYPSRVADLLSVGTAYRFWIKKRKQKQIQVYPYLQLLFKNIKNNASQPTLLGYCCKILTSLIKKTPQIYQFVKDNQQYLIDIIKDDQKLNCLKQFLSLFLTESTMELYLFLKSMLIRNIIYRIVDDQSVGVSVYKCIDYFYENAVKGLQDVLEDEKEELVEVCKIFQDEHFITLMILKLDSNSKTKRNKHIGHFLCKIVQRSAEVAQIVSYHIDTLIDYLQQFEQSQTFMNLINLEHVLILKLLVQLLHQSKLPSPVITQLIKRLLVYSNVHSHNSCIHNLLFKAITYCYEEKRVDLLKEINLLQFFVKSQTQQQYGFMSLRRRIFKFYSDHRLLDDIQEESLNIINKDLSNRRQKLQKSVYFKDWKYSKEQQDFSKTKVPQSLVQMINPKQSQQ